MPKGLEFFLMCFGEICIQFIPLGVDINVSFIFTLD